MTVSCYPYKSDVNSFTGTEKKTPVDAMAEVPMMVKISLSILSRGIGNLDIYVSLSFHGCIYEVYGPSAST